MSYLFTSILGDLDHDSALADVSRVASAMTFISEKFYENMLLFSQQDSTATVVEELSSGSSDLATIWAWAYDMSSRGANGESGTGILSSLVIKMLILYSKDCTYLLGIERGQNNSISYSAPSFYQDGALSCGIMRPSYYGVLTPPGEDSMLASLRPVTHKTTNVTVGYMLMTLEVGSIEQYLSNATAASCVTVWSPETENVSSDADYGSLKTSRLPGTLERWNGTTKTIIKTSTPSSERNCSDSFENTTWQTSAFFVLDSGLTGTKKGPVVRLDVPRKDEQAGISLCIRIGASLVGVVAFASALGFFLLHKLVICRLETIHETVRGYRRTVVMKPSFDSKFYGEEEFYGSKQGSHAPQGQRNSMDSSSTTISGDEIGAFKHEVHSFVEQARYALAKTSEQLLSKKRQTAATNLMLTCARQSCWLNDGSMPGLPTRVSAPVENKSIPLEEILENHLFTESLKYFCTLDHSAENLQFLIDVAHYKAIVSEVKYMNLEKYVVNTTANMILDAYLVEKATSQLNVSSASIRKAHYFEGDSACRFDEAVRETLTTLSQDILPRFFKSAHYRSLINLNNALEKREGPLHKLLDRMFAAQKQSKLPDNNAFLCSRSPSLSPARPSSKSPDPRVWSPTSSFVPPPTSISPLPVLPQRAYDI